MAAMRKSFHKIMEDNKFVT